VDAGFQTGRGPLTDVLAGMLSIEVRSDQNVSGIVEWHLVRDDGPRTHGVVNVGGRLWKHVDKTAFYGQLGAGVSGEGGIMIFHYSIGAEYLLSSLIRPSIFIRRYFDAGGMSNIPLFVMVGISVRN
jgi:hypothetical protein